MSETVRVHAQERSLASIISEMKEEGKQFIQTRLAIFSTELRERADRLKAAAPLGAVAALIGATSLLLLSMALVSLIAVAFDSSPYRWFYGFLIVGITWAIAAGIAGFFAYREINLAELPPKRTIEVLKADKLWLESEAHEIYDSTH